MIGKWAHLVGKYPERKLALVNLKEGFQKLSMAELEEQVSKCSLLVKTLKHEKSKAEQDYLAASEVLIERWGEDGTRSVKREHIGLLARVDDIRARVKDMKAFKAWAADQGLEEIIQETVNANTLSSTVKALLQDGEDIPECISLFTQSRVNVTKPKGAK